MDGPEGPGGFVSSANDTFRSLSTPFPLSFVVAAGAASEVSSVVCIESDFDFDTNVGKGSGNWKKNSRS